MKPGIHHYLEPRGRWRRHSVPVIVIAVILAFGVSLVASAITTAAGIGVRASLLLGVGLLIGGFACAAFWLGPVRWFDVTISGVLPMDIHHRALRIEGYELSRRLQRYLSAIMVEDEATAQFWSLAEIGGRIAGRQGEGRHTADGAKALVREALEYFVLDKLSEHLSGYRIAAWPEKDKKIVLQREHVAEIRRGNRFLELFSSPLDTRREFIEDGTGAIRNIRFAISENGALFQHFQLRLPRGSALRRVGHTGLLIDTPRFKLTVSARFDGYNKLLPDEFERLYLGQRLAEAIISYDVQLRLSVEYRWSSFLKVSGWGDYEWVDSFLDKMVDDCAFDTFLANIGWRTAATTAIAIDHLTRQRPRSINAGPPRDPSIE